MKELFLILFLSLAANRVTIAQSPGTYPAITLNQGGVYASWGYNRDFYSKSDIHFINTKTDNYNFTIRSAKAEDRPSMDRFWQPSRLTIPQYNMHIGYMFGDRNDLGIEIGWNHLKYVMTDNQVAFVNGSIRGRPISKDTIITPGFVQFEHTNGNNYLLVSLVKKKALATKKTFAISAIGKIGVGPLVSYSHSRMFGSYGEGPFRYEGWVTAVSLGIRFSIHKYFFVQTDAQGAFANYTSIKLGADKIGRATQHFYSFQFMFSAGVSIPFHK